MKRIKILFYFIVFLFSFYLFPFFFSSILIRNLTLWRCRHVVIVEQIKKKKLKTKGRSNWIEMVNIKFPLECNTLSSSSFVVAIVCFFFFCLFCFCRFFTQSQIYCIKSKRNLTTEHVSAGQRAKKNENEKPYRRKR